VRQFRECRQASAGDAGTMRNVQMSEIRLLLKVHQSGISDRRQCQIESA